MNKFHKMLHSSFYFFCVVKAPALKRVRKPHQRQRLMGDETTRKFFRVNPSKKFDKKYLTIIKKNGILLMRH